MIFALLSVLVLGGAAAVVDARTLRLPNRLTGPAFIGAAAPAVVQCVIERSAGPAAMPLAAGLGLAASYLVASVLSGGDLGLGDVKLAAGIGTALGYIGLGTLLVATLASTLSALVSIAVRRVLRADRSGEPLAFGPHMMLGFVIASAVAAF